MCCNRCSGMEDRESSPMIMDVNRAAKENCNFRKSVWKMYAEDINEHPAARRDRAGST